MKRSMMGCSKYEYNPKQFEIDVTKKTSLINDTVREVEEIILKRGHEYVKETGGRIDNFKDDVMKWLVKNHLGK